MAKDNNAENTNEREVLIDNLIQSRHPTFTLSLPLGNGKKIDIPLLHISYVEAQGAISILHMEAYKTKQFRIGQSIGDCETLLNSYAFARIHRKFIINLSCIKKLTKNNGSWKCNLICGTEIPIARRQQKPFIDSLNPAQFNRLSIVD